MKKLLTALFLFTILNAMPPPTPSIYFKSAYSAYKKHNYKEAFKLYTNAVASIEYSNNKRDNFKALYNLALCYDKGIGTKPNKVKAAIYYIKAYNIFKDDIYDNKSLCQDSYLPYYKWVLKRLDKLEGTYIYSAKLDYIKRSCNQ